MVKRSFYLISISMVVFIVTLSGCVTTTQVLKESDQFAANGIAFADSVAPLIDESFVLAVNADSLVLAQARENIADTEIRGAQLKRSNKNLEDRLKILRDLKRHAYLLRSYFVAIRALTQTDAASGITDATKGLVEQLEKLEPGIAKFPIGDKTVSEFIEPAAKLAVAAYQNSALRKELAAHADTIDRELALQDAALTALYEQMRADKEIDIQVKIKNAIFRAYTGQGRLPGDWSQKRVEAFKLVISIDSYESAVKAAKALRQSWQAFAEKRLDSASLLDLSQLTQELVALAEKIKGERQ